MTPQRINEEHPPHDVQPPHEPRPPRPALEQEAEELLNDVDTFAGGDTDVGPTSTQ